jgi:hypothetical protein
MNDAVKKESQPAGFTAAPPPPQVDGANAVDVSPAPAAAAATATPHALGEGPNIAVPQDTAVKALQAVQVLVENNRSASQQLESLMAIVLDAAEVANRSASTVAATGNQLFKAADTLAKNNRSANIQAKLVLALTGTVLVGAAVAFSFMTMQLNEKVEQVDAMLLAVGKRAVDLKARLEAMDDINATLAELSLKQDNTQSVQMAIEDKLARVADQTRSFDPSKNNKAAPAPATPAPAQPGAKKTEPSGAKADTKTDSKVDEKNDTKANSKAEAKPVAKPESKTTVSPKADKENKVAESTKPAVNDQLNQQLSGLDALLTQQSKAVLELSQQLNSVKSAVSNVDSLKKDIENLSNLQKQRNQEAALAAVAAADARRDRELKERELKERELKERELLKARDALREREIQREREAMREREIQREREAAQARAATPVEAAPVAKEKPKSATFVKYSREQSNTKTESQDNIPTYSKPSETKQQ